MNIKELKFEPFYFFTALLVGFFLVYVFSPEPHLIIKNPESDLNTTFLDDSGVCYRYEKTKVSC